MSCHRLRSIQQNAVTIRTPIAGPAAWRGADLATKDGRARGTAAASVAVSVVDVGIVGMVVSESRVHVEV